MRQALHFIMLIDLTPATNLWIQSLSEEGKRKSKNLQGVDLLIVGIPLFLNILCLKMRVLTPE
jgi:hypothetical protein